MGSYVAIEKFAVYVCAVYAYSNDSSVPNACLCVGILWRRTLADWEPKA
jgi:hypothetical protein